MSEHTTGDALSTEQEQALVKNLDTTCHEYASLARRFGFYDLAVFYEEARYLISIGCFRNPLTRGAKDVVDAQFQGFGSAIINYLCAQLEIVGSFGEGENV